LHRRAAVRPRKFLEEAGGEREAPTTDHNDLADAFRRAIEDCGRHGSIQASLSVTGGAKELHPVVRDEIYRIGYEAIRNACMHSGGSRLEIEVRYARNLTVRIADDGVGIQPAIAARKGQRLISSTLRDFKTNEILDILA
jgi:signal transduction histidine kinase